MDWRVIFIMVLFPYVLLFIAFWMRDHGKPAWSIRKFIHTIGLTIVGIYGSFLETIDDILLVLFLFLLTLAILTLIPKLRLFSVLIRMGTRQGEKETESIINTTLTTSSMIILLLVAYDTRWIFLAGVLSVAIGDGLGEFIGKPFGKHKYKIIASKSIEGSFAVFFGTFIGALFSFYALSSLTLDGRIMGIIVLTSIIAMIIESISISFIDNVAMPWAVAGILWYLV